MVRRDGELGNLRLGFVFVGRKERGEGVGERGRGQQRSARGASYLLRVTGDAREGGGAGELDAREDDTASSATDCYSRR